MHVGNTTGEQSVVKSDLRAAPQSSSSRRGIPNLGLLGSSKEAASR